jgi:hypothetical protein
MPEIQECSNYISLYFAQKIKTMVQWLALGITGA